MKIQSMTNQEIQYHILKTEHKGFVKGECMIPMGILYADYNKRHIPGLMADMLKLGTQSKSEEALNEQVESKGIQLSVASANQYVRVRFTCLTKYLDETIALIAELLSEPKFDQESFENLKQRELAKLSSAKDNTGYRAQVAFLKALFPKEHIVHADDPDQEIALLQSTKVEDLKNYHKEHADFSKAKWVIVGDVPNDIQSICEKHMPNESKDTKIVRTHSKVDLKPGEEKVHIKDKQSVDFLMGHVLDMDRKHQDFIPLMLALDALGGSFSARLMRTVRDVDGLTYNVGSAIGSGIHGSQCYWTVHGSFAPKLLDKGIKAIEHQLRLWVEEGLSQEELDERKMGLLGKYQVRLSDASSLVGKISSNLEHDFDADYLYTFCEEIEKVTLDDVNGVIQKYIQLDKVVKISAGSL